MNIAASLSIFPRHTWYQLGSLLLALLLAACSGGGGGGSSNRASGGAPAPQAPNAQLQVSPSSGQAPLLVVLDGSASTANGGLLQHHWEIHHPNGLHVLSSDDGPTGPLLSYVFAIPGDYEVRLRVTDSQGMSATTSAQVNVLPATGALDLTGSIQVLSHSAVDGTTNDSNAPQFANNSFAQAQLLPNPVSLAGFVNQPETGASSGVHFTAGDPSDFYLVSLSGQETLLLSLAEPSGAILGLNLWRTDPTPTLVDALMLSAGSGTLQAPAAGSYYLEVFALAGASNYNLILGQHLTGSTQSSDQQQAAVLSDDFVPGELLVSPREPATNAAMATADRSSIMPGRALMVRRQRLEQTGLAFQAASPAADMAGRRDQLKSRSPGLQAGRVATRDLDKLATLAAIARFNHNNDGEIAEPNFIRRPLFTPDDQFFSYQWQLQDLDLPGAWQLTQGSPDVIVAVLDTGILPEHPDLANSPGTQDKLVPGYDFISDATRARDGDGIDPDPTDPGDLAFGTSSSFHGTHVAGIIAAHGNNGTGIAGVSWHTRIMPLRVLGVGGGTSYDLIQAIRFAAGLPNDSGAVPAQPAHIINLSLGGRTSSRAEQQALAAARQAGVFLVAAAGNDGSSLPTFPAAYPEVLAVSATSANRQLAPYSNFGNHISLAAPGGNNATNYAGTGIGDGILSTVGDDSRSGPIRHGYAALNGTSMAAPHVAGVIALMKALYPALTPDEFEYLLSTGALTNTLDQPGFDPRFGFGLINARKAVIAALELASAQGGTGLGPMLIANPSALQMGAMETSRSIQIRNLGSGNLRYEPLTTNRPWLSALPLSIDQQGMGQYQIFIDRDLMPTDGHYSGNVRFNFRDLNDDRLFQVSVQVVAQKLSLDVSADAGHHYVVLVDAATYLPVANTQVSVHNGQYHFALTQVPAGSYRLFAGTDHNGDGYICDTGEACGAFPTLDAPAIIHINAAREDLHFTTGLRNSLASLQQPQTTAQGRPIAIRAQQGLVEDRNAPVTPGKVLQSW